MSISKNTVLDLSHIDLATYDLIAFQQRSFIQVKSNAILYFASLRKENLIGFQSSIKVNSNAMTYFFKRKRSGILKRMCQSVGKDEKGYKKPSKYQDCRFVLFLKGKM